MIRDYSKRERELLKFFGVAKMIEARSMPVMAVYRSAMEQAFLDDMQGPEVESLRRCMRALQKGEPYRNTPEWDELIKFSDDPVLIVSRR